MESEQTLAPYENRAEVVIDVGERRLRATLNGGVVEIHQRNDRRWIFLGVARFEGSRLRGDIDLATRECTSEEVYAALAEALLEALDW